MSQASGPHPTLSCPACSSGWLVLTYMIESGEIQVFCRDCKLTTTTKEIENSKLYTWVDYEEEIPVEKKIKCKPPKKSLIQKWAPILEHDEEQRKWEIENPEELFTWEDYENE